MPKSITLVGRLFRDALPFDLQVLLPNSALQTESGELPTRESRQT